MKKLIKYLKPYWLLALLSPFLMMGEVLADLVLPYLTTFLVNYGIEGFSVLDPDLGNETAHRLMTLFGVADGERMGTILLFGGMMLVVTLIGGCFGVLCAWTATTAAQGFGKDLRKDAFARVMSLSIEQTDRFTTGSLVTRMTNDISMIVDFIEQILRMFVRAPMFLIGGTFALLMLELRFGVVLGCAIPVLLILLIVILVRTVPLFGQVQKRLDRVNSVVEENVNGARVVKAYVREEYESNRFDMANRALKDTNLKVLSRLAIMDPVLTLMMNLAIAAVIWIGGWQIQLHAVGMTAGTIMAAITYITQVIMSVMMVTMMFQSVSRALASAKRVSEVLSTEPVIRGGQVTEVPPSDCVLRLTDVSFRYPGTAGDDVLKHINLEVRRGEVLAVIGATGTGKTTLVSLIPRFYDATSGEVQVDGVPVKQYDLKTLRQKIGFVMQKSELFSDTIENNILWGKPDAMHEEVEQAVRAAQAEEFVNGFTDTYHSYIAEKGASLSGGQKQRTSIARALVRQPEILILDDSTSALDLATESRLRASLRQMLRGTTVIMVAQRIASVREADRIAVIEADGRILHCASHEELLRVSATYRDICASQSQATDPGESQKGGDAV